MTAQSIIKAADSIGARIEVCDDQFSVTLKARGYKAAAMKLAAALGVAAEPDTARNNKPYWVIGGTSVVIAHFPEISSAYRIWFDMDDLDAEDAPCAEPMPDDAAQQDAMISAATAGLSDTLPEVLAEAEPSEADRLRAELDQAKAENIALQEELGMTDTVAKTWRDLAENWRKKAYGLEVENKRLAKDLAAVREWNEMLTQQGAQMATDIRDLREQRICRDARA